MTRRSHRNGLDQVAQGPSGGEGGEGQWREVLDLLVEHGFEGLAQAMQRLLNEAMKLERSVVLEAEPYERTPDRRGYANGFKPKRVNTRLGALELQVPQTRGVAFCPSALERGTRSERALKLAVAEMYLQGVSTRKVTAVLEELCGLEVTSTQVSRVVQALDEALRAWRERPLGEVPYLLVDARYEKVRVGGVVASCARNHVAVFPPTTAIRLRATAKGSLGIAGGEGVTSSTGPTEVLATGQTELIYHAPVLYNAVGKGGRSCDRRSFLLATPRLAATVATGCVAAEPNSGAL